MERNEILPYSLMKTNQNSNEYYSNIKSIADQVMNDVDEQLGVVAAGYQKYIEEQCIEVVRTIKEYELELLVLGVLWRGYGHRAQHLEKGIGHIIRNVVKARRSTKLMKAFWSFVKGKLTSKYLIKENDLVIDNESNLDVSMEAYSRLLFWLDASGEFEQEVIRLSRWRDFFEVHTEFQIFIGSVLTVAKRFEELARKQLGSYTTNVVEYRKKAYTTHSKREDILLCTRGESEYHLNMVGAQIMNDVFRADFQKTEEKYIYLPGCMVLKGREKCKAKPYHSGYLCQNCTPECTINQITEIAKQYHAKVMIVYHESSLYKQKVDSKASIGVVGVACVLNLLSGGWKAKDLGYVPQCVLLDYCGCKGHWHENGVVTNINMNRLISVLSGTN
ncbi:MAG TPA: DUF116 domain-containing protein [Lachnospiraceae bacterium]|nr:DUF116 domain-containing protein [Lachnospiraceae bacterium]